MTHDWSHLDDAVCEVIANTDGGSSLTASETMVVGAASRQAILFAITPSDLAALIAEKCPEFVCVTKSPPSSWSWPQQVKFDRATTEAIEAYYPHKQADYAIAQRLELVRQVLQSALDAAPKLGEDN